MSVYDLIGFHNSKTKKEIRKKSILAGEQSWYLWMQCRDILFQEYFFFIDFGKELGIFDVLKTCKDSGTKDVANCILLEKKKTSIWLFAPRNPFEGDSRKRKDLAAGGPNQFLQSGSFKRGAEVLGAVQRAAAGEHAVNRLPARCQPKVPKTAQNAELCIEKMEGKWCVRCGTLQRGLHEVESA